MLDIEGDKAGIRITKIRNVKGHSLVTYRCVVEWTHVASATNVFLATVEM